MFRVYGLAICRIPQVVIDRTCHLPIGLWGGSHHRSVDLPVQRAEEIRHILDWHAGGGFEQRICVSVSRPDPSSEYSGRSVSITCAAATPSRILP